MKEQPGSSTVVQGVASDTLRDRLLGRRLQDRRRARGADLGRRPAATCFDASAENAYSGEYPIARFLYVYLNKDPNATLDPLRGEFVRYVYSKQGQEGVVKDGYFPVTAAIAAEDRAALGLE